MSTTRKVAVSETGHETRIAITGDVHTDTVAAIRRPIVARHPWRTKGEPFDPRKVADTPTTR